MINGLAIGVDPAVGLSERVLGVALSKRVLTVALSER